MAVTLASLFAILGVYSQRLAHRIFEHPKFLEMMRLHSKTILKLNASILSVFVLAGFIVTLNLATFEYARFELFDNVTITNATKPLGMYLFRFGYRSDPEIYLFWIIHPISPSWVQFPKENISTFIYF